MIDIPPEIRIDATLQRGAIYYFYEEELTSPEPHYFVLISDPQKSEAILLLLVATSQIAKREAFVHSRNLPLETLVRIAAGTLSCFTKETIFDCNHVFTKSKADLVQKLAAGRLGICTTECFADDLIRQMVAGVLASPLIEESHKRMLRE